MLTLEIMESLFPTEGLNKRKFNLVRLRQELVDALNHFLPLYGITTRLQIVAFLAVCGLETDYFRTTREYASGAAYEGRHDLGNYFDGDGKKYPGSSIIQTTGRYNFWRVVCRYVKKLSGKDFSRDDRKYKSFRVYLASEDYANLLQEADRLDCNFLAHPEKLQEVYPAVEAACIFWEENDLNKFADKAEFKKLSAVVNKGDEDRTPLHWGKRKALYDEVCKVIPKNFSLALPTEKPAPESQKSDAKTSVKDLADKYLKHLPKDKVVNAAGVVAARSSATAATAWSMGWTWRLIIILALIPVIYAVWYYRKRILEWLKYLLDSFLSLIF